MLQYLTKCWIYHVHSSSYKLSLLYFTGIHFAKFGNVSILKNLKLRNCFECHHVFDLRTDDVNTQIPTLQIKLEHFLGFSIDFFVAIIIYYFNDITWETQTFFGSNMIINIVSCFTETHSLLYNLKVLLSMWQNPLKMQLPSHVVTPKTFE